MSYRFSLVLIIALSGCSTTSYQAATYTGPLEIYPAVFNVFEEMHTRVDTFDLKTNTFISKRVYNKKLNLKYGIEVSYKNNVIETKLIDVQEPHAYHKTMWVPYNDFLPLNDDDIRKAIDSEIVAILQDEKKYNQIKAEILSELGFHYAVASKLPKPEEVEWINKYMAGKKFELHMIKDETVFRKNNTDSAPAKKYIAHLHYDSKKWVDADFDLDLYTNNASYETMPINTHIDTLGQFINAKIQVYIVTYGFSFDQIDP